MSGTSSNSLQCWHEHSCYLIWWTRSYGNIGCGISWFYYLFIVVLFVLYFVLFCFILFCFVFVCLFLFLFVFVFVFIFVCLFVCYVLSSIVSHSKVSQIKPYNQGNFPTCFRNADEFKLLLSIESNGEEVDVLHLYFFWWEIFVSD
jgi:hypothetical protein